MHVNVWEVVNKFEKQLDQVYGVRGKRRLKHSEDLKRLLCETFENICSGFEKKIKQMKLGLQAIDKRLETEKQLWCDLQKELNELNDLEANGV